MQVLKFKKLKKSHSKVGLDIGTYSIKAAEIEKKGDVCALIKFAVKDILPMGTPLADQVKSLLDESGIVNKSINISFSGPSVVARFINMPLMSIQDLKNAMRFEGEKYIPFGMDEIYSDCCILGEGDKSKNEMSVLLAAVKKNIVHERLEVLKGKGFNIDVVDVDAFCLFNAFIVSQKDIDKEKNIALFNMGHSHINIIVLKDKMPYFARDINIGGQDLENEIVKNLGTTPEKAREMLLDPAAPQETIDACKNILSNMVDEARLSFGYYENQFGRTVDGIYASGGLSGAGWLVGFLEQNLGTKPVLWNPFSGFEIGPLADAARLDALKGRLAVSLGLALRE